MSASLVGSEMCIRDRLVRAHAFPPLGGRASLPRTVQERIPGRCRLCLLYTSALPTICSV
eukprot:10195256-Alexandrium_andersonii.AAC.1